MNGPEGSREFNFINPGHIITKFDMVVIMWEEFEINMFEEVTHLPLGPPHPSFPSAIGHFVTQK